MVASDSASTAAPYATRRLLPLVAATVLLVDGWLIHSPQGAVTWRLLSGKHSYGASTAPSECWWDYEGGWSVGRAVGFSPAALQLVTPPSSVNTSSFSPAPLTLSSKGFSCADIPVTPQRRITFVADPFLLIPTRPSSPSPSSASLQPYSSSTSSAVPWYLFFEQKNVAAQPTRGELGVAASHDEGRSWQYVDQVITDVDCHLSYPFVLYTHELREVRLYTATSAALPLGWTYRRSPLQGAAYVDCSVVWQPSDATWYVFVTIQNTLHLYYTRDLLNSDWLPHPASPLYQHDRSYGRSAGRPVMFDGVVHRFAQEQTHYYGEGVRVMRVNRLSRSRFEETEIDFMQPTPHSWPRHRLHHVDAVAVLPAVDSQSATEPTFTAVPVSLSARSLLDGSMSDMSQFAVASGGLQAPLWLAVVDGDDRAVDELLWREEGWFIQYKRALLLPVLLALLFLLYKAWPALSQLEWRRCTDACRSRVPSPLNALAGQAEDELPLLSHMPPLEGRFYKLWVGEQQYEHSGQCSGWTVVRIVLQQLLLFCVIVVLVMSVPTFVRSPSSPAAPILPIAQTSDGSNIVVVGSMVETATPTDGSVWVITAASSVYFDRVRNFIGSMHTYASAPSSGSRWRRGRMSWCAHSRSTTIHSTYATSSRMRGRFSSTIAPSPTCLHTLSAS